MNRVLGYILKSGVITVWIMVVTASFVYPQNYSGADSDLAVVDAADNTAELYNSVSLTAVTQED